MKILNKLEILSAIAKINLLDYIFGRCDINSPGHNHFWILDDVTNMDVVVGHRGNSLITLFEP